MRGARPAGGTGANGELILTGPTKVKRQPRGGEMESWKPIFKEEPNEAALDLFMHSKYDRRFMLP